MRRGPSCRGVSVWIVCGVAALACFSGCRPQMPQETMFSGEAQGTTYAIKIVAQVNDGQKRAIETVIRERLDAIDREMSLYRDDSELAAFNRQHTTTPFSVSANLIELFQAARDISEATSGAFDVTVAPLVRAWGFGPESRAAPRVPTDDEISPLIERVGYTKIDIDAKAHTLRKIQPDIACDLNGIAQGFTVDKLAEDLEAMGYIDYCVEVGGEIRAHGHNARGMPWQAGIELPDKSGRALQRVVSLNNMSLTTAGDYRNWAIENGTRVSHIIDPRTGHPVAHRLASVSVIHSQCTVADGYDTALMVLGPEEGYRLAVSKGLAALFTLRNPDGTFDTKTTPAFEAIASRSGN